MPSHSSGDSVKSLDSKQGSNLPVWSSTPKKSNISELTFIDYKGDPNRNDAACTAQKSLMRAHVMRDYHRRQKQQRAENLKASMKEPPHGFPSATKQCLVARASDPELELRRTCCDALPLVESCYECQRARLETALARVNRSSEKFPLKKYLGASFMDPFASTPVPMTDTMDLYFRHFRTFTMAACYPLDPIRMSIWWWRTAQEIPALLHAIIFLSAGHQALIEGNQGNLPHATQKSSEAAVRHRGESLHILNKILVDPVRAVTEANILTVAAHHSVEAISGNVQAVDAHMKGLMKLVELQGGLESLQHTTLSKIYMSDVKHAALKLVEPAFTVSKKWRKGILQLNSIDQVGKIPEDLSPLGSRFFSPEVSKYLDKPFLFHLQRFRSLVIYHELALRHPSLIKPTDNDMFILYEHQLLSLPYDKWTLPATEIQECTRIATLLYSNVRIWKFTSFPFIGVLLDFLREALIKVDLDYFMAAAPDLLFWILFVGSAAAKGHVSRTWFLTRLARVGSHLWLYDWLDAKARLTEFFFVDRVLDTPMEELWKEVVLVM